MGDCRTRIIWENETGAIDPPYRNKPGPFQKQKGLKNTNNNILKNLTAILPKTSTVEPKKNKLRKLTATRNKINITEVKKVFENQTKNRNKSQRTKIEHLIHYNKSS